MTLLAKHKKKLCRKRLKQSFINFLVTLGLGLVAIILSSLLYFYIEHCSHQYTPTVDSSWQLCQYLEQNTTVNIHNHTTLDILCKNSKEPEIITCEMTKTIFFKYFDLTSTMAYTVGYGHVYPMTDASKLLTIFIILPLIALAMTSYAFAGKVITSLTSIAVLLIRQKIFGIHHGKYFSINLLGVQFCMMVALSTGWAAVDNKTHEASNRSFLDSMYVTMVTISTVGFGDLYWSSEEYFDKGFHYFLLSMFGFLFAMGTFASTITQICELFGEYSKKTIQRKMAEMKNRFSLKKKKKNASKEDEIVDFSVTEEIEYGSRRKEVEIIEDVTWYKIRYRKRTHSLPSRISKTTPYF